VTKVTFLGGAETVTGSKFLVSTGNTRILVDCGLFQGYKRLRERNREPLPVDIDNLDAVILTHAHLDHSGYLPVLYRQGFRGPVITQHATRALCGVLLPDSGHLQEEDAKYYARHKLGKHTDPQPLYDRETAEKSMELFDSMDYEKTASIGDIRVRLQPAGHILGAASVVVETEDKRIGFSGDVGRSNDILMYPPHPLPELDLLLLESTYGNRRHDETDSFRQLETIVNQTAQNGGVLLIPSFAVGRAQTIQHMLVTLIAEERIPELPIFLDSPMAIDVSNIYCKFAHQHRLSDDDCKRMCKTINYTREVNESKALAFHKYPHIIIAGSGMATGGRILHHFKRLLPDHRTTALFIGYQAGGTRGAKMIQGAESVKIHGQWIPCKANVEVLHGLSGHADYVDIHNWLERSSLDKNTRIKLIHGEPDALESQQDYLRQHSPYDVTIAGYLDTLTI
jgi:metallo-beta-lactamase family protein